MARRTGELTAGLRSFPDFLIIGTKRGGTTALWRFLLDQPTVLPMFPSRQHIKSPHYFYWHYGRGDRWYRSHFATRPYRRLREQRSGRPTVVGEASPYYLYDPRVPERVARTLPTAKIIVLLRDPVRRAYSHYWERVDQGVEPLSFADALAAEPARLAGEVEAMMADPLYYSRAHDWYSYRDRGLYLPQLRRWQAHLPADRFLILRSEDFYAEPPASVKAVLDFLGVPTDPVRPQRRHNYRPAPPMDPAVEAELRDFYREPNARLAELLGRDLGW